MSSYIDLRMGSTSDVAQGLYEDAIACVERSELRRAQTKLRLALAYDPAFVDARYALERLTA